VFSEIGRQRVLSEARRYSPPSSSTMEEASMKRAAVRWAVGLLTDGVVLGSLHPEFAG
jgi:hypothetical protein